MSVSAIRWVGEISGVEQLGTRCRFERHAPCKPGTDIQYRIGIGRRGNRIALKGKPECPFAWQMAGISGDWKHADQLSLRRLNFQRAACLDNLPMVFRAADTPLTIPFKGRKRYLSRSAGHDAIKRVFGGAASWLRAKSPEFLDQADELERASAHWFRHTTGSQQADGGVDLLVTILATFR